MKRRDILKKVGAGVVLSVGATGLASSRSIEQIPVDTKIIRGALADREELLENLATDGLIESASPDEFELQNAVRPGVLEDGVFVAPAWFDGVKKRVVTVGKSVDEGYLKITYDPDSDLMVTDLRTTDGEVSRYGNDVGTAGGCGSCGDGGECETCVCTCDSCGVDCCSGFTCTCEPYCP